MNEVNKKAKELILLFMPNCGQYEFGKYIGNELLHKNARESARKCVLEIMKSDPTMPRTIPHNEDELLDDIKQSKYFQIAQSKDFWNDVLKAIETVSL